MTTQDNTQIFESLAVLSINELRTLIIESSHLLIEKEQKAEEIESERKKAVIVALAQSIGLGVNFH